MNESGEKELSREYQDELAGPAAERTLAELFRSLTANRWWLWLLGGANLFFSGALVAASLGFMLVLVWPWLVLGYLQVRSAWALGRAVRSKDTRYFSRAADALGTYFMVRGLLFLLPLLVIILVSFLAVLFGDAGWYCFPGDECRWFFQHWQRIFPEAVDV